MYFSADNFLSEEIQVGLQNKFRKLYLNEWSIVLFHVVCILPNVTEIMISQ